MPKKTSVSSEQLAGKLNYLFGKIHPPNREFTNEEVAAGILERKGMSISANYVGQLRSGRANNPSISVIEALADFFGVRPSFFLDDRSTEETKAEIELRQILRDNGLRSLALSARHLSPAVLASITALVQQLSAQQGDEPRRPPETPDDS